MSAEVIAGIAFCVAVFLSMAVLWLGLCQAAGKEERAKVKQRRRDGT